MNLVWLVRSWPARRALHARVSAAVATAPRPMLQGRFRVDGVDLLRVKVIGSGLAVGYGVTARADGLDGQLAQRLAEVSGRGVSVSNLARHDARLVDQISAAEVSDSLDLDDIVVWSPSSLEMCARWWPRSWSSQLRVLLEHISCARQVIVLALPVAEGRTAHTDTGAAVAQWVNSELERATRGFANVAVVHPPPLQVLVEGSPRLDPAFYAACAARITAALTPAANQALSMR